MGAAYEPRIAAQLIQPEKPDFARQLLGRVNLTLRQWLQFKVGFDRVYRSGVVLAIRDFTAS